MKKSRHIFRVLINIIFVLLLFQSIGSSQENDPLVGKWYCMKEISNIRNNNDYTKILIIEKHKKKKYKAKYFDNEWIRKTWVNISNHWALSDKDIEEISSFRKVKIKYYNDPPELNITGIPGIRSRSDARLIGDKLYILPDTGKRLVFKQLSDNEILMFGDNADGKISHFSNPKLLQYPSSYKVAVNSQSVNSCWGGWFTSRPFKDVRRIKGSVFNKQTGITFDYYDESSSGSFPGRTLNDILFDDIPNPATGVPPASFTDLIEPEIIETQYKNYDKWFPIQYLSDKNIMLFGYKKGGYSKPIFYMLDLNQGTVQEKKQEHGYHFLFSNRFLGNYLVASKQGFLYYDYMNDIELSRQIINSELPNETVEFLSIFDRNMVNDENLWLRILSDNFFTSESGRWVKFGYVDQDSFHYVYSVNETDENKIMFEIISDFQTVSEIDEDRINSRLKEMYERREGNIREYLTKRESITKNKSALILTRKIKISNDGLIQMNDKYGSIYVLNLKKDGLQERKFSSIQVKNNMLTEEDKQYLAQFKF